MSNKMYDVLKIIALIVLPLSEFVSAMAHIWGWSCGAEIAATLIALDTFLGAILKISSDKYHGEGEK